MERHEDMAVTNHPTETAARDQILDFQTELVSARELISLHERQIQSLIIARDSVVDERNNLRQERDRLKAENAALVAEMRKATAKARDWEAAYHSAQMERDEIISQRDLLRASLKKVRHEIGALIPAAEPVPSDWMPALTNGNEADAQCLQAAWDAIEDALTQEDM